jgi:ABC-type dipeptide/oligopeptide/nickel transport system ATPase component
MVGTAQCAFAHPTRFHTRCRYAMERCKVETPSLIEIDGQHRVACWLNEGTGR